MLVGIISDTHENVVNAERAFKRFAELDVSSAVHCGDWVSASALESIAKIARQYDIPLSGVLGNRDVDTHGLLSAATSCGVELGEQLTLSIGGAKIGVYHGHHKPTLSSVIEKGCNAVLTGHTHKALIENISGVTVINPGSLAYSIPRSKEWKPSIALYDTNTDQASIQVL